MDNQGKQALIAGATEILGRHAGIGGRIPACVVIREVPESNWGIFGAAVSLEALRASPKGAPPIQDAPSEHRGQAAQDASLNGLPSRTPPTAAPGVSPEEGSLP
ncbi:tautomerase family protein [Teichococcus aestuarii]|uniref:tautomerase family protein n=1 Tax=Teichococcus aestuarii TaxID=568898 RepID=UPI00360695B3